MLAWIKNSPRYGENDDNEVLEYIDQVASCSADVSHDSRGFLDFQRHKHSRSCRKGSNAVCRFGIPFPPMRKTLVIQPYTGDDSFVFEDYYKIVQDIYTNLKRIYRLMSF